MRRWILAYSLIIGMNCGSIAYAQTFFGTEATPPKEAGSNVLSASEFQQKVKSLNNKRQENLNQKFQDQVAKQPPLDSATKGPAITTPSMTTTDTADKPITTPTPPAPQQQAAPYTGFGGSQPTKSAPASNSDSGGGWNVNY